MSHIETAIAKCQDEADWFEAQAKRFARSRKHDASTRAKLVASYKGGKLAALAEVQRLQAEKCRLDSLAGVKELFSK